MNTLNIKKLNLYINETHILKDVSLEAKKANITAIVGESGSGKSMICSSILRLYPLGAKFDADGEVDFLGEDLMGYSEERMMALRGEEIGMIYQEPMSALNPLHTVYKQISEVISTHHKAQDLKQRVKELLKKVELDKDLEKILASYPHELSGGQRQRVMIAMAIANKPKLLIADEPTTALDVSVQFQVLSLLKKLQKEFDMSILLITHDLGVVREFSDYIYVICKGKIVEYNATKELFANPKDAYTKLLLGGDFEADEYDPKDKPTLLDAKDLSVRFPIKKGIFGRVTDEFRAVKNVSFSLKKGESFGIIGESGSGKSTLAMALLLLEQSEGDIRFLGQDIKALDKRALRKFRSQMQVVFQDPFNSLNPRLDVYSIISEGLDIHTDLSKEQKQNLVLEMLKDVGLASDSIYRYPHEFSGGQRQRIALLRALVLKPKLLILDEPTSALDRQVQFSLLRLLKDIQKKYDLTYIFISHDLEVIQSICGRVAVMKEGCFVEVGQTKDLFSSPKHPYTKELVKSVVL